MIIRKITIQNLFAYYGRHEFCLARPVSGRNINMIIAKNGSGKTSLHKAINILFHGILFSKDEAFIRKMIKGGKKAKLATMEFILGDKSGEWSGVLNKRAYEGEGLDFHPRYFIEIELENTTKLEPSIAKRPTSSLDYDTNPSATSSAPIILRREFMVEKNRELLKSNPIIYEEFYINIDGMEYKDRVDSNGYPSEQEASELMAKAVMKPSLIDFFFFDGEQLEDISRDLQGSLGEKIKDLLNITALEKMVKDLKSIDKKYKSKNNDNKNLMDGLKVKEKELEVLEQEIWLLRNKSEQLGEDLRDAQAECDEARAKLDKTRRDVDSGYKDKELSEARASEAYLGKLATFREIYAKYLLHASALGVLKKAEKLASSGALDEEGVRNIEDFVASLQSELKNEAQNTDELSESVVARLEQIFTKSAKACLDRLEHSTSDTLGVPKSVISNILGRDEVYKVDAHIKELDDAYQDRYSAKEALLNSSFTQEEDIAKIEELERRHNMLMEIMLGKKDAYYKNKDSIHEAEERLQNGEAEYNRLDGNLKVAKRYEADALISKDLRDIVECYKHNRIRACRASLSTHIKDCLSLYLPDIDEVEINEDFAIIIKKDGKKLALSSISAGQEQVVATAIIYGLFKEAVDDFPLIIDTPLGRVDNVNRQIFFERVYHALNEQVILLVQSGELGDKDLRKVIEGRIIDLHLVLDRDTDKVIGLNTRDIVNIEFIEEKAKEGTL